MCKICVVILRNSFFLAYFLVVFFFTSCEDKNNKSLVCESFFPLEGGMNTQVTLVVRNMGNMSPFVEVRFNEKRASVVNWFNDSVRVLTPMRPGDECTIHVKIGRDSAEFLQKFTYHTQSALSTLVGQQGATEFNPGLYSEVTFQDPCYLTIDVDGNLFLSHYTPNLVALINKKEEYVIPLTLTGGLEYNIPCVPVVDLSGKVIMVPLDGRNSEYVLYFQFNANEDWAPRLRSISLPSTSLISPKFSFAICELDGMVYFRSSRDGAIMRFDLPTRTGEWATDKNGHELWLNENLDAGAYLAFDPFNKSRLFGTLSGETGLAHCVAFVDVVTGEEGIYAGGIGKDAFGWKDGAAKDARFNNPKQIVFDNEGNLLIADAGNHCIRKISRDGIVSTVAGVAGISGYKDGPIDEALLDCPWGICVDRRNDDIYIVDRGNKCIRIISFF